MRPLGGSARIAMALLALTAGCGGDDADPKRIDADGDADADQKSNNTTTPGDDGVVWPNGQSSANSSPWLAEHHAEIRRIRPRILALNFVNASTNDAMVAHMKKAIDALAEGSRYHGYLDAAAAPFVQYEIAYAVDLRDPSPPAGWSLPNSTLYPRENPVEGSWGFDYEALFTAQFAARMGIQDTERPGNMLGICALIDRGLIHEVWIYSDADVPDVSAAEILELKPYYDADRRRIADRPMNRCAGNGCFDDEDDIPCQRTVRVGMFNSRRGEGCYMESLSHSLERIGAENADQIPYLARYFIPFASFDLDTRFGLPFRSWYACPGTGPCLQYPDETTVDVSVGGQQWRVNDYDPVCGNAHFAPNSRSQYDLDSSAAVKTSCTYFRDGSGRKTVFTREAFARYRDLAADCMGPWDVWWRQNIPGLDNDALDDAGQPMLNWWPFIYY